MKLLLLILLSQSTHASWLQKCVVWVKGPTEVEKRLTTLRTLRAEVSQGRLANTRAYLFQNARQLSFEGVLNANRNSTFPTPRGFVKVMSHPAHILSRELELLTPKQALNALGVMLGNTLMEMQGGPHLLGFGLHPLPDGRLTLVMEFESAFGDQRQLSIKEYAHHANDPFGLIAQGELPSRLQNLIEEAFRQGIAPVDPEVMLNTKGEMRWIDGDLWVHRSDVSAAEFEALKDRVREEARRLFSPPYNPQASRK